MPRFEILHHGLNETREYWADARCKVVLRRRRGADTWTAMVDRKIIEVVGPGGIHEEASARTVQALASLLADRGIHLVFDEGTEWQQDVTGWPVRVIQRPPRPEARS